MDATWAPAGVSSVSTIDGMVTSSHGALRHLAVLDAIECAFEVIEVRSDVNSAGKRHRVGNASKRRQRRECEIDFRHSARSAIVAHLRHEIRRQLRRPDEREKRGLRIESRYHCFTADLLAAGHHTGGALVAHEDAFNGDIRPDLGARLACGGRHCLRDRARPAARPDRPSPCAKAAGLAQQHHQGTACRSRPQHRARYAGSGEHRPQLLVLEPLGHEIGHRHRQPAQQTVAVPFAESAKAASRFQKVPHIPRAWIVDVGRRRIERGADDRGQPVRGFSKRRICLRIFCIDGSKRLDAGRRRPGAARAPDGRETARIRGLITR